MNIEEELARALAKWRSGENFEAWEVDMYAEAVAALMPLIRRAWDEGQNAGRENVARSMWEDGEALVNPYAEQEV